LSALLLFGNCLSAFAEVRLPDGTAAGLPEKLTVMDSDGNAVNGSGEYFFHVEGMSPNTDYSKDIQIMNLREDKAYHIYFYAEPISKSGEIDLEENCTAVFTLDGKQIFEGKVSGEASDGSINLSDEPIDLGLYEPGKSRKLNCTVTWDGTGLENGGAIDYGSRLVDTDGTHILREGSGSETIYGETEFRWIFYAVIDENYTPPYTGMFGSRNVGYLIAIIAAAVLIIIMLLLIAFKKKKRKQGSSTQ
jgi:hypothetical protein